MGSIHLSNSKGRDAMVATRHIVPSLRLRWLDRAGGRRATRVLTSPIDCDPPALQEGLRRAPARPGFPTR